MPISINLKKAQEMLMRKSLYFYITEFWDTWETAAYKDNWLVEWQSECFMYSVKHFLPIYIVEEWVDDKTYEGIKKEANAICPVRDKIFQGKHVRNHDWNMPPRHMKSSIMNVAGPTWLVTNMPVSVASVSHTAGLSGEMNTNRLKILQSDKYRYYFSGDNPGLRLRKESSTNIQTVNGAELYSVCQVSFTGFGADCFVGGTKVSTPFGDKEIQNIKPGDVVYSYNVTTGKRELSKVQYIRKVCSNGGTIRVSTSDGRSAESTADHRYWVVGKGYIPVADLSKGDKFRCEYSYKDLYSLWKFYKRSQSSLQKMYVKDLELSSEPEMCKLWKNISENDFRILKTLDNKIQEFILLQKMLITHGELDAFGNNNGVEVMSYLQKEYCSAWKDILLHTMYRDSIEEKNREQTFSMALLSVLRQKNIFSVSKQILLQRMCKQSTFRAYARNQKLSLSPWKKCSYSVSQGKTIDFKKRSLQVRYLRNRTPRNSLHQKWCCTKQRKFVNSSYRHEYEKQFIRKFSDFMFFLSYKVTQECEVSSITRNSTEKVVYDIQVSKNHNFFANGILVHNCIIADDLISADNAAKDKQVLKNALTFFTNTLPTRLNSKTTGVIWQIQQRLAPGDISGTILGDPYLSQIYSHTELQAISDRDINFIYPCSGKVKEIHKGDLLWEERFGDYTELRFSMGESKFQTQYQQDARSSDSAIVKEDYIHYIEDNEIDQFKSTSEMHYASHDCPVKDAEINDYHGFAEGYGRGNELLITDAWQEHMGYVKEKQLLQTLNNIDPAIGQIIEDKANGAALLQDLKEDVPGLITFDPGTNSKSQRLGLASVYMQSGAVRFVRSENTQFLINQLLKFPFIVHDDIVDAFSQLVLYHFTQRKAGVYTNCFTYQNIIPDSEQLVQTNQCIFGATMNGQTIKVLQVRMDKDKFIVCNEWQIQGIERFEEFYINTLKSVPVFIDASYENSLYNIINNPRIILRKFNDRDRDRSIQLMKVGFYKKKILVEKHCMKTTNDISKLRNVQTAAQLKKGTQVIETVDEGYAGCLRGIITTQKGLSGTWY